MESSSESDCSEKLDPEEALSPETLAILQEHLKSERPKAIDDSIDDGIALPASNTVYSSRCVSKSKFFDTVFI